MKAQAEIMEYILLTLFIVIIIIGLVFFLSGWNITQLQLEKEKVNQDRALFIMKYFLNSPMLVKENSVMEDKKLDALSNLPDECRELEKIIGGGWFAEIETFGADDTSGGKWQFCIIENRKYSAYIVPINIYKKIAGVMEIGTLKVGVYE